MPLKEGAPRVDSRKLNSNSKSADFVATSRCGDPNFSTRTEQRRHAHKSQRIYSVVAAPNGGARCPTNTSLPWSSWSGVTPGTSREGPGGVPYPAHVLADIGD